MTNTLQFEQLRRGQALSGQELVQLASLIYDTDPFIYPALFSSKAQAKRVLSAVFMHGGDNMFCPENCFVGMLNGELSGLVLWVAGSLKWSDTALWAELERDSEPVSPGYAQAKDEYFSSYQTNPDTTISIVNFSVDSSVRGQGVGGAMMCAFLQEHPEQDMELFVLDNNTAAYQLYQRAGFSELQKLDGFALGPEKPACTQMYRRVEFKSSEAEKFAVLQGRN